MSSKSSIRRRSAVFLVYVHQLPRWVPLVLLPALLIVGLALPGVGGAIALALLALVLWFLFLAEPARNPAHRAIRLAVPLLLVVGAILKLLA